MPVLKSVNDKVSDILKTQYNEVVYSVWLSYVEHAVIEDCNVVLDVPNLFIKNIIEERYLPEIESLYKNEIQINKVLIKSSIENSIAKKLNDKDNPISVKSDDNIEKVNSLVSSLLEFIETAVKGGFNHCYYKLEDNDCLSNEDYYSRVKDFLSRNGLKIELTASNDVYALNVSW